MRRRRRLVNKERTNSRGGSSRRRMRQRRRSRRTKEGKDVEFTWTMPRAFQPSLNSERKGKDRELWRTGNAGRWSSHGKYTD